MVSVAFRVKEKVKENFYAACERNSRTVADVLAELMESYTHSFGQGAQSDIREFINPQFIPAPSYFAGDSVWKDYLAHCLPSELDKIQKQAILIQLIAKEAYWDSCNPLKETE